MLKEKKHPHTLWREVFTTTSYMLNRCPTKNLKKVFPFEKWTGDNQSVSHFRIFGFVCYKRVPGATRKKLDDKSKVMLLIGYHIIGAYKLYCQVFNKVEVSRDVIVKETEAWDENKSQSNYGAVLTPS